MFNAQKTALASAVLAASLVISEAANAALDTNIATGLTALKTDFDSLMALVYPIAIGITTALVIFGLVKMFIHKAAR